MLIPLVLYTMGAILSYFFETKEEDDLNDNKDEIAELGYDNKRRDEEKSAIDREPSAEEEKSVIDCEPSAEEEKSAIDREPSAEEEKSAIDREPSAEEEKSAIDREPSAEEEKSAIGREPSAEERPKSDLLLQDSPYPPPFRYATFVNKWNLTERNWLTVLDCITTSEAEATTRFIFDQDKRMALGSRLLHRKVACESFGMDWKDVKMERRKGYKPVLRYHHAPKTWNMNVSHHGGLVAIASDSYRLCGVDTMDLTDGDKHSHSLEETEEYLLCFRGTFTPFEWSVINGLLPTQRKNLDRIHRFLIQWSMKEAYVKAIGEGLLFDLLRVEFEGSGDDPNRPTSAIVRLDGKELKDWNLRLQYIGSHVLCVALGKGSSISNEAEDMKSVDIGFEFITLSEILPHSIASALE